MKIKELMEFGRKNIKSEEAYRISKMLIKYILNVDETYLIINNEEEIDIEKIKLFKSKIESLSKGIPIQYITHKQEFMGLEFYVDSNVLIPQPDTEILVEEVIKHINKENNINVLDLCTGSGAIGISIAKNMDNSRVCMADISKAALNIASKNAIKNEVEHNCKFVISDMFSNILGKYNVLVSNPPYIESKVIETLSEEVKNEPYIALDGGEDGLEFYKIIAKEAYKYLEKDGILALEIGYNQKEKVIELINNTNEYKEIYCKKDLNGNDRCIICKKK